MSEMLEKILSDDNIKTAYKRVYANKGAGGIDGITISELEEYMQEHYGFKVSSKYIGQIKEKCRMEIRENFNKGNGKSKDVICPEDKERAIMEAFKHFGMLN